jgi:hypothetical protein
VLVWLGELSTLPVWLVGQNGGHFLELGLLPDGAGPRLTRKIRIPFDPLYCVVVPFDLKQICQFKADSDSEFPK